MTKLLTKAFQKVSELPEDIQDTIAGRILIEIEDELKWQKSFKSSFEKLESLGNKAVSDHSKNRTRKIGFDEL